MVIAYQFKPCDTSLAIYNSAVTTRNLLFLQYPLHKKNWYLSVFLYPFQANDFSPKQIPLKRHNLPSTSTALLSHISWNITLNYLCITLGNLSKPLIFTTKFLGPVLSQVYHSLMLPMVSFFPQWWYLVSEVFSYYFKI